MKQCTEIRLDKTDGIRDSYKQDAFDQQDSNSITNQSHSISEFRNCFDNSNVRENVAAIIWFLAGTLDTITFMQLRLELLEKDNSLETAANSTGF